MTLVEDASPEDRMRECRERKAKAIAALTELVDGPSSRRIPVTIADPAAWVHKSFYLYRSGMDDNDPGLPRLARIEHDFIAAIGALNFDDQKRQLRQALRALEQFSARGNSQRPQSNPAS